MPGRTVVGEEARRPVPPAQAGPSRGSPNVPPRPQPPWRSRQCLACRRLAKNCPWQSSPDFTACSRSERAVLTLPSVHVAAPQTAKMLYEMIGIVSSTDYHRVWRFSQGVKLLIARSAQVRPGSLTEVKEYAAVPSTYPSTPFREETG